MKQNKRVRRLAAAVLLAAGVGWFENCTIQTEYLTASSPALPEGFAGFRIALIADLHGASFSGDNAELCALVRGMRPDIIAICGDLADKRTDVQALGPFLEELSAAAPCFYVTGNHEWVMKKEDRQALFSLLEACGIERLENEYRVLERGGDRIILAGADDPNGPLEQKTPAELVRQIRQAEGEDSYILMLSHRNEMTPWCALSVQTVLCGHAHGSVVRLPGIGALYDKHDGWLPPYTAGICRQEDTTLVVSRGLGTIGGLPLRLCNRPHLPLVTLQKE